MNIAGKRVLVVEDEPLIAMLLEDILVEIGCEVVGPAAGLADALALAESERPDLAILDLNLGADSSLPVAERLESMGVPFAFATGYGQSAEAFAHAPCLAKPYRPEEIATVLQGLLQP